MQRPPAINAMTSRRRREVVARRVGPRHREPMQSSLCRARCGERVRRLRLDRNRTALHDVRSTRRPIGLVSMRCPLARFSKHLAAQEQLGQPFRQDGLREVRAHVREEKESAADGRDGSADVGGAGRWRPHVLEQHGGAALLASREVQNERVRRGPACGE